MLRTCPVEAHVCCCSIRPHLRRHTTLLTGGRAKQQPNAAGCRGFKGSCISEPKQRKRRRASHLAFASQASEALQTGREKYDAGDRMGALRQFEAVLRNDPSLEERQAALYNATCVHAGFGDVELAQLTLRDGVTAGLEFEAALKDPELIKLNAPPQVVIQLRKFADTVKKVRAAVSPTAASAVPPPAKAGIRVGLLEQDVSSALRTDITGIDASALGIVRRVGLLLLIALAAGATLFYVGLPLTFGESRRGGS